MARLMNLVHHVTAARPNLPDSQRAALLMGSAASFQPRALQKANAIPFARPALRSTVAMMNATASAGPMLLAQELFAPADAKPDLSTVNLADPTAPQPAPPRSPRQRKDQRRAALLGSAGAVVAGVLTQRLINHSAHHGNPAAMAGRTLGAHLATGGVAGLIVLVTEQGLGNKGRSTLHGPLADVVLGGLVATAQTRALRRAAASLTLPTSQYRTGRLPR